MIGTGLATATYLALWLIVIVQTLVLFELMRQIGILRRHLPPEPGALLTDEGLARGAVAPPFTAIDLRTGEDFSAGDLRGRSALLVFLSPSCAGCHLLAPKLRDFANGHKRDVAVVVVCPDSEAECRRYANEHRLSMPVLLDEGKQISLAYGVRRTPSATLIDASGRIRIHGIPNDAVHLEGLLAEEGTPMAGRQWLSREEGEVVPMAMT